MFQNHSNSSTLCFINILGSLRYCRFLVTCYLLYFIFRHSELVSESIYFFICLISTFIFLCRQENETKETPDLNFIHTSFVIILHRTSELVNLQIFLYVSKFTQTPVLNYSAGRRSVVLLHVTG